MVLACEASAYGLGAVLSHTSDKSIAVASRTLSKAELNYSQIKKEALALVHGVGMKRFQQYLYGNHFTLITNHQPLVSTLHPDKALPSVTAAQLQWYVLVLSEYTFHIRYRSTHCHGNADALSCLPLAEATEAERQDREELDDCPKFRLNQLEQIPVTTAVLQDATYSVGVQKGGIPWRSHEDQMVTGSADSLWHDCDRAEIIDGDHGPEPDKNLTRQYTK